MLTMKLNSLIKDTESIKSYIFFREIEDWCSENIPKDKWKFRHSPSLTIYGVDIPGQLIFKRKEDYAAFKLHFSFID